MGTKYSTRMANRVEYSFWLVFDSNGGVRLFRSEPTVKSGERAMNCAAVLPTSLFQTPTLKASIKVDDAVGRELKLDVQAVSDALKTATGIDFDLKVMG